MLLTLNGRVEVMHALALTSLGFCLSSALAGLIGVFAALDFDRLVLASLAGIGFSLGVGCAAYFVAYFPLC